jgi:EAL domain-containing protein (putative c-di-GMP-specific phosphodiesterase class I)
MGKARFIFAQDMTKKQMVEVILKLAREHGVKVICEREKTPKGPNRKP